MRLIILALALALGGCAQFLKNWDAGCTAETVAHNYYVANIAASRPAAAVAKEAALYAKAMAVCAAVDATYPQVQAALAAVKAAKAQ